MKGRNTKNTTNYISSSGFTNLWAVRTGSADLDTILGGGFIVGTLVVIF